MVIWITGKANAGKTTLAYKIHKLLPTSSIILDGDEIREIIKSDFTDEGRKNNILTIAKLAALSEKQGLIAIVALVSPKKEWRDEARSLFKNSILIHVKGGKLWENTIYEQPDIEEADITYSWEFNTFMLSGEYSSKEHVIDSIRHLIDKINK